MISLRELDAARCVVIAKQFFSTASGSIIGIETHSLSRQNAV